MANAWELIRNKQYQAAIDECTRLYMETKSTSHLRNRGAAFQLLKDYKSALADYQRVIEIEEPQSQHSGDYIRLGICYWWLEKPSQTVAAWRQALTTPYTDAAGGVQAPVMLLYAAQRLKDAELIYESLVILTKMWRNHERRRKSKQIRGEGITQTDFAYQGLFGWPGAITPFILGKLKSAELRTWVSVAAKDNDILRARFQCQADFYLSLDALRKGDIAGFKAAMVHCAGSRYGELEDEYYLALWEVEHGFPDPAFKF
jgi:tetratricopeptide (TPR) repeat protein